MAQLLTDQGSVGPLEVPVHTRACRSRLACRSAAQAKPVTLQPELAGDRRLTPLETGETSGIDAAMRVSPNRGRTDARPDPHRPGSCRGIRCQLPSSEASHRVR